MNNPTQNLYPPTTYAKANSIFYCVSDYFDADRTDVNDFMPNEPTLSLHYESILYAIKTLIGRIDHAIKPGTSFQFPDQPHNRRMWQ